jgi:hypothetical protein
MAEESSVRKENLAVWHRTQTVYGNFGAGRPSPGFSPRIPKVTQPS